MKPAVPDIVGRHADRLSPWVALRTRKVRFPGSVVEHEFHSFSQSDYVNTLAVTTDGRVSVVRQFRIAIERLTLELPGGLRDVDETPEDTAMRELYEETGFRCVAKPVLLGRLSPDPGRLENHFWCYFVQVGNLPEPGWKPEREVEPLLLTRGELKAAVLDGSFDHAPHVGLLGLACLRGVFRWD